MPEKTQQRLVFIINVAYVATIVMLVYVAFQYAFGWVLPFIVAFCIVSLVDPLIRKINKKLDIKQEIISVLVMVVMYAIVGFLLFWLLVQVVYGVRELFVMIPAFYEDSVNPAMQLIWKNVSGWIARAPEDMVNQMSAIQDTLVQSVYNLLQGISQKGIETLSGITTKIPNFLIAFIFTIMLSFFISVQYDKVTLFIKRQLPPKAARVMQGIRSIVKSTVVKYIRAIFKLMMITFVELSVGLLLLRTPHAILVAAGISIFDALPFFGTGAMMIPWVFVELLKGNFPYAGGIAILYGIITVVRNIIEPKIIGDKLGLNPIVSLVSIYLGYKLFGVLGMIFMPILTQIALELHHRGTIKLFRETQPQNTDNTKPYRR